jgi:NADPH2:quinone reductase
VKAVRVHAPGGPEALRYEDVPQPTPKAGEVVVALEAIGVNFIDVYFRKGLYKAPMPFLLGLEGAGTVRALGEGVEDVKIGDRVAYSSIPGSYAELVAVPVGRLVSLPDGISAKQGAAAMIQGMTAHFLACAAWQLQWGQRCLVHAAAGGVGLLLCQIAKLRGAHVIGTVSTEDKAELARRAGADDIVFYEREDLVAAVKRLTGGKGVDVVYDGVGRATFEKSLDCVRARGMIVLYGQSSGPVPQFEIQLLNQKGSLFVTRPNLAHYVSTREELLERAGDVFRWIRDGKLEVRIGAEFPLREAAEAHRALEGRNTTGKVLLIP